MGNLYTDNLIGTVIGLSVADDWEGARREWRIVGCDGYNDYLFLLDMFNGGFCSEAQERKCQAIIMQSIYPWLRNLWKKSKSQKGKIDNGK